MFHELAYIDPMLLLSIRGVLWHISFILSHCALIIHIVVDTKGLEPWEPNSTEQQKLPPLSVKTVVAKSDKAAKMDRTPGIPLVFKGYCH